MLEIFVKDVLLNVNIVSTEDVELQEEEEIAIKQLTEEDAKSPLPFLTNGIFGNFRDFEDITLDTHDNEGIFLDGALKITKSIRSQFKVRGRICRSTDFDRIVSHLKEEEKMVI